MSRFRHRVERMEREATPESEAPFVFHRCERGDCPEIPRECWNSWICTACGHEKFTLRLDPNVQDRIIDRMSRSNVKRSR